MADAVLRLDAPGVPADAKLYGAVPGTRLAGVMEDAYLRRDGHDVPEAGETAAAFAARQAAFATAVDVYQVRQRLGAGTVADPVYRSLLARFESAEAAASWFPGIQAFAQIQGVTGVVPVPVVEAPRFGDESLTLAFQFREGETASAGYLISARVGADVVIVLLRAAEAPPLATVAGLMTAQLVCLEARACLARHPVPPEVA